MASTSQRVLLGLRDARIDVGKLQNLSFLTNKIGDVPNCMPCITFLYPTCTLCGETLLHIVQVYCPLEGSLYHRTINVFACPRNECSGKSESWKVLRSQCLETEARQKSEAKQTSTGVTKWCDGADDWGMDSEETPSRNMTVNISEVADFTNHLQRLSFADNAQEAEDIPLPTGTTGLIPPGPVPTFQPYYINVIDEEELCMQEDTDHALQLLKEYQNREGIDGIDTEQLASCKENGGEERYEKTKAKHGDEVFMKFMKRVSLCQEQVLRYSFNGQPLFISAPPCNVNQMVPFCNNCGSCRRFELQIMPAMVSMLRSNNEDDLTVEFGTVLIYTCEKSCWPASNHTSLEEFLFLQSDPDQNFFK
ncbi:programmed cell death protein 2-like isoform X1 [Polypterus senegalus]|uniref:programmed cell death protein 2-like isoform X1 n=2 Tax=Polypterus senegalus TaxID=55291 RepID=UPI001964F759|nr:programmed cell death protein 2-like isoform X1 [Polypterus senegalus]